MIHPLDFTKVTEAAALAASKWIGCGDKNSADNAAVVAMRESFSKLNIAGKIVIGEGEIDEAPMLYIGEEVGNQKGPKIDIAVDPIDGTRMTAVAEPNALAVLAATTEGGLMQAPDMYMEKLVVGKDAKDAINLEESLEVNLQNVANALNKSLNELTLVTFYRDRHEEMIQLAHQLGVKVIQLPDGDILGTLLTCLPDQKGDLMYCIGGAPEGVISGAIVKALGGNMQCRLKLRDAIKPSLESSLIAIQEQSRCEKMNVKTDFIYKLDDIVKCNDIVVSATAITDGFFLKGIEHTKNATIHNTLLIDGKHSNVHKLTTYHYL